MGATQGRGMRLLGLVLSVLLAVTLLPVAGIQSAFADEPVERPATSGGDVALQSANGAGDAAAASSPVAEEREGGMLAASGLLYTVADGGLALVGFDEDAALEGALAVPAAVFDDGRDVAVVAVDLAEGSVAEGVTALSIPQSIKDIRVETLAPAFPSLLSIEVASGQGSTLPAAAGAAAMRATYSSFGGALLGQATVEVEGEDGSVEPVQCRELLWAPPAAVAVRLPVDCLSVAPGALADASGLETIVCFGDVQRIATAERDESGSVTAEGGLVAEQLSSVTVVFPDATPAVPSEGDGRVSASMALNDGAAQTDKRHAWIELGLPLERLSMGKPVGALTETVAVNEDGTISKTDLELVSYPGMHPRATDVKHPGEDGTIDMAESGLAFTMRSDMTLSVRWQGDVTATPAHLEIPAYATIDGVKYPVTEIAPEAFKGAVFLTAATIPETVTAIGAFAFADCPNLTEATFPASLKTIAASAFDGTQVEPPVLAFRTLVAIQGEADENTESAAATPSAAMVVPETVVPASEPVVAESKETPSGKEDLISLSDSLAPFAAPPSSDTTAIRQIKIMCSVDAVSSVSMSRPCSLGSYDSADRCYDVTISGYSIVNLNFGFIASNGRTVWFNGVMRPDNTGADTGGSIFSVTLKPGFSPVAVAVDCDSYLDCFAIALTVSGTTAGAVADGAHKHAAGDITSGTLATALIPNLDAGKITSGTFGADRLKDAAVTAAKLASNAVEEAKIKDGAVTSAKIKDGTIATADLANNSVTDDKLATKFGSITYSGLDGGDLSVYPTSYRQGGAPAIPVPERDGFEFAGWSWARGGASGDSANIASAFSEAGTVALTANWTESTKGANCFFAESALDSSTGGAWTSTIAVRLTADVSKTSVSGIAFAANDLTGLLKRDQTGGLPDVAFAVGSSKDGVTGSYGFGGSPAGTVQLCDVEGGKGVWVKITIPAGAIDTNRVVGSLTAEDYVASLARMTYTSLA